MEINVNQLKQMFETSKVNEDKSVGEKSKSNPDSSVFNETEAGFDNTSVIDKILGRSASKETIEVSDDILASYETLLENINNGSQPVYVYEMDPVEVTDPVEVITDTEVDDLLENEGTIYRSDIPNINKEDAEKILTSLKVNSLIQTMMSQISKNPYAGTVANHAEQKASHMSDWVAENPYPTNGTKEEIAEWGRQYGMEEQKFEQDYLDNNPEYKAYSDKYNEGKAEYDKAMEAAEADYEKANPRPESEEELAAWETRKQGYLEGRSDAYMENNPDFAELHDAFNSRVAADDVFRVATGSVFDLEFIQDVNVLFKKMNLTPEEKAVSNHDSEVSTKVDEWLANNPYPADGTKEEKAAWSNSYDNYIHDVETEYKNNNPEYAKMKDEYDSVMEDIEKRFMEKERWEAGYMSSLVWPMHSEERRQAFTQSAIEAYIKEYPEFESIYNAFSNRSFDENQKKSEASGGEYTSVSPRTRTFEFPDVPTIKPIRVWEEPIDISEVMPFGVWAEPIETLFPSYIDYYIALKDAESLYN